MFCVLKISKQLKTIISDPKLRCLACISDFGTKRPLLENRRLWTSVVLFLQPSHVNAWRLSFDKYEIERVKLFDLSI